MTDQAHALFSPSSAHKWMRCTGALAMEDGLPDSTTASADEGTAAHELASWVLTDGVGLVAAYEGRIIEVVNGQVWDGTGKLPPKLRGQARDIRRSFEVDEEMCDRVQIYVDAIRNRVDEYKMAGAVDVTMLIETRVDISEAVGIDGQFGTSDAIILVTWADGTGLIDINDLKYGYHLVHAEQNEQMMVYALGVFHEYSALGNYTRVRMSIHQPRREHLSDWECSAEELLAFGEQVHKAANLSLIRLEEKRLGEPWREGENILVPGEKQCQWCKAAGTCPALARWSQEVMGVEFEDLTKEEVEAKVEALTPVTSTRDDADHGALLARYMRAVPLLDIFARGILAATEAHMFNGGNVPGFKVVAGKKGRRKFRDEKEAEELMKSMRLRQDEMYNLKLISPTQAEKKLAKESPRRWKKLEKLITQSEGQPAVVEESDKRPPLEIKSPEDDFEPLVDGDDLV